MQLWALRRMGGSRLSHAASPSVAARASSGRVKHGLGGFAVGQANTASSTPHARDKSQTKSQTKTQPKTPSKPSKKEKDTLRHTLRHMLQGPHRDCTVPREAATGPLRPSSAARSLSFSLAWLASLLTTTDYSLAPSLTRFPAVSCASSCKPLAR